MGIRSLLAVSLVGCAVGCDVPEPRGELVGRYEVLGDLQENSCGRAALPAADPLSFVAEIRIDRGEGLWIRDSNPPFSGSLTELGDFRFDVESVYPVTPAEDTQKAPTDAEFLALLMEAGAPQEMPPNANACRLLVIESVRGTLFATSPDVAFDAGAGYASAEESDVDLTADNQIDILAEPGSDCAAVLATRGGPFLQLPCRASYTMRGELDL